MTVPAPMGEPLSWRVTRRSSYPRRCSLQHSSRSTGMRSVTGLTETTGAESVYDSAKAGRAKAVVTAVKIRVFFMAFPRSCSGDSIGAAVSRRTRPGAGDARGGRAHLDVHGHFLAGIVRHA